MAEGLHDAEVFCEKILAFCVKQDLLMMINQLLSQEKEY